MKEKVNFLLRTIKWQQVFKTKNELLFSITEHFSSQKKCGLICFELLKVGMKGGDGKFVEKKEC